MEDARAAMMIYRKFEKEIESEIKHDVLSFVRSLEEIAGEGAEIFHEHGGENFTHIACLNDSKEGMKVLESIVRRELGGWI